MIDIEINKEAKQIVLQNENQLLKIQYADNGDLYFIPRDNLTTYNQPIEFLISEDESLYDKFETMYNNILLNSHNENLVENKIIKYHSDDGVFDTTSILNIELLSNVLKLTFYPSEEIANRSAYIIRICSSGSRYPSSSSEFFGLYKSIMNNKVLKKVM